MPTIQTLAVVKATYAADNDIDTSDMNEHDGFHVNEQYTRKFKGLLRMIANQYPAFVKPKQDCSIGQFDGAFRLSLGYSFEEFHFTVNSEDIQNHHEWKQMNGLDGRRPMELVFHGSSEENIERILKEGFDMDLVERGLYGKGINVSKYISNALRYTTTLKKQTVLIGFMMLGNEEIGTKKSEFGRDPFGRVIHTFKSRGGGIYVAGSRHQILWIGKAVLSFGDQEFSPLILQNIKGGNLLANQQLTRWYYSLPDWDTYYGPAPVVARRSFPVDTTKRNNGGSAVSNAMAAGASAVPPAPMAGGGGASARNPFVLRGSALAAARQQDLLGKRAAGSAGGSTAPSVKKVRTWEEMRSARKFDVRISSDPKLDARVVILHTFEGWKFAEGKFGKVVMVTRGRRPMVLVHLEDEHLREHVREANKMSLETHKRNNRSGGFPFVVLSADEQQRPDLLAVEYENVELV